jgi:hypothetical protein
MQHHPYPDRHFANTRQQVHKSKGRDKSAMKIFLYILYSVLLVHLLELSALGATLEESLLKTWEEIQKEDPKIVKFEKLEDNKYRFKTIRFPFDGELIVLNVGTEDNRTSNQYGSLEGYVEVELVGLPENFIRKYSHSYYSWSQNNRLHWDENTEKWIPSKLYFSKGFDSAKTKSRTCSSWDKRYSFFMANFTTILVIVLFVKFWGFLKYYNKDYYQNAFEINKKSIQLSEENNRILREILEALKGRNK